MSDIPHVLFPRDSEPSDADEAFVIAKRKLHESIIHLEELHLWWRRDEMYGHDLRQRVNIIETEVEDAMADLAKSIPNDYDDDPPPDSGWRRVGE